MKITIENGEAYIATPYNADFVAAIKQIGGARWDAARKCWKIPEVAVDAAREIMKQIYGESDISHDEKMTLRIKVIEEMFASRGDVTLYGKCLAHACGRDGGARVGDDVAYVAGKPTSGGSAKNWCSVVEKDSEIILTNVSRKIYERTPKHESVEIVEIIKKSPDKKQLESEREQLLKRIAEIDALLQG